MSDDADQGQLARHTPPRAAGDAASSAQIGAAEALPGADPLDLLAGSPDLDALDLFAMAAEPSLFQRRARGRPLGSLNRKSTDTIRLLAAKGHRDPWETLSLIQSCDVGRLADALRVPLYEDGKPKKDPAGVQLYNPPNPEFAAALIERAAGKIMNYHHSAKPQQLDLPVDPKGGKLPAMFFGDGAQVAVLVGHQAFDSAGIMPGEKPNEINGDAVRQATGESHDTAKPLETNDDRTSTV